MIYKWSGGSGDSGGDYTGPATGGYSVPISGNAIEENYPNWIVYVGVIVLIILIGGGIYLAWRRGK